MQEIKDLKDMEMLTNLIEKTRKNCKKEPDTVRPKGGFLAMLRPGILQSEECIEHNEKAYAALPKELRVTKEAGELLATLFLEHLKAKEQIDNRRLEIV